MDFKAKRLSSPPEGTPFLLFLDQRLDFYSRAIRPEGPTVRLDTRRI